MAAIAGTVCAIAACAEVAGLDELVKDDCADGCTDAGPVDANTPLDARNDGATADAAIYQSTDVSDAGSSDASATDASFVDATTLDGSPPDSMSPDASTPDSGGACGTVFLAEPFSNDFNGWTLDATWGVAATCSAPPTPQKGLPDPTSDHTTSTTDNGVAGAFLCGNNPASTTSAARYLTSPIVDTAGAPSLKLTFYRWLNSDSAGYMSSTVDVYDGTAWVNVYTNPTGSGTYVTDSAWNAMVYDLSAYANASLRVRFGYSVLSTSVYEMSSWNVDDVTISTLACP
jgi:hypothetical protein